MTSNTDKTDKRSEYTDIGEQMQLNVQVTQVGAEISNVRLVDNVTFREEPGIAVNFQCQAYGFKGYPLYFYAYVLYENDYDFVVDAKGDKVYGFDTSTAVYDAVQYKGGITLYIPYSSLPPRYHGELCIDIVIKDCRDNIIANTENNRFFYSTL